MKGNIKKGWSGTEMTLQYEIKWEAMTINEVEWRWHLVNEKKNENMTMQEEKLRGHTMRCCKEMAMHEVKLIWNKRLHSNAWNEMKMALNETK